MINVKIREDAQRYIILVGVDAKTSSIQTEGRKRRRISTITQGGN